MNNTYQYTTSFENNSRCTLSDNVRSVELKIANYFHYTTVIRVNPIRRTRTTDVAQLKQSALQITLELAN